MALDLNHLNGKPPMVPNQNSLCSLCFPKSFKNPSVKGYPTEKMCVVTLQLNDPLQKVVILKKNNYNFTSKQQQHSQTQAEKYLHLKREARRLFVHHHQQ